MTEHYKKYLIIGGMPECVQSWTGNADPEQVSAIQEEIVSLCENDFTAIAKSARAKDFEDAIEWLVSSGIAYRILNVSKPDYPLKVYEMLNYFKLFLMDVGLIKHIAGLTNKSILLADAFQFKGQLAENYVLEQLIPLLDRTPNFYSFAQEREIDFIFQHGESIIPLEVKSGGSKSAVSFKSYIAKHNPETAIRFSTNEFLKTAG